MELLDGYRPTDAEAWTYIIHHEAPIITNSVPSLLQEAFVKVLEGKWPAEVVARINIHDFAVIWSDSSLQEIGNKASSKWTRG